MKKYEEEKYNDFLSQANKYIKCSDYKNAEDCYLKALKINSKDELIHLKLGNIYLQEGRLKEAENNYTKAIKLNSSSIEAYKGLMAIEMNSGNMEKMSELILRAEKVLSQEEKDNFKMLKMKYEDYERYKIYEEVVSQYQSKEHSYQKRDGQVVSLGYCFSKLVDFNGDGIEELVLAYTESVYDMENHPDVIDDYIIEVWTCLDGRKEQLFSGQPLSWNFNGSTVSFVQDQEKYYLKTGNINERGSIVYYGYENGKFEPANNVEVRSEECYILQGNYLHEIEGEIAWNQANETPVELSYWEKLSYQALAKELNAEKISSANDAVIKNGSYKYMQESEKIYLHAYTNLDNKSELELYYATEDGTWSSCRFVFDEDSKVYLVSNDYNSDYALSIEQMEDVVYLMLQCPSTSIKIRSILERDTKYDLAGS